MLLGLIGAAGDQESPPNSIASAVAHISSDVDQAEEHSAEGSIELSFWRNSHDDPSSESRSVALEDYWGRSSEEILLEDLLLYIEEARSSLADYFRGIDLDVLHRHLPGLDRHSRSYESMQARKAVDGMPMVTITENTDCSICLEEFEMGEEAKETGCKHRFHGRCIFSWLELHRSCPLCRCRICPDSASRRLPLIG
ncbi:RING-type E3 ubiquitin transferase [Psidium guajava]|nr:RING-type E3 ubiquitin transferase [Psidium guajava]